LAVAIFTGDTLHQPIEPSKKPASEPELNGQCCELPSLLSDKPVVDDPFIELIQVSDAITYQLKHDGEICCTYAGFSNKSKAKLWGNG